MDERKARLVESAARLYSLGLEVEAARDTVKTLTVAGASYDSPDLIQALNRFNELKKQWDCLEQKHLKLKAEIMT